MSAALRPDPPPMTVTEFYAWAADQPGKWQLVDGQPVAMSPPSVRHGTVHGNIAGMLHAHLLARRSPCRLVIGPGVSPRMRQEYNARVPDLAVTCATESEREQAMREPVLIVEVLSPSNERDTRANVWAYTTIPGLRDILVVRSLEVGAELWRRGDDGAWPPRPILLGPGDTVELTSLGARLALDDCYRNTALAVAAP